MHNAISLIQSVSQSVKQTSLLLEQVVVRVAEIRLELSAGVPLGWRDHLDDAAQPVCPCPLDQLNQIVKVSDLLHGRVEDQNGHCACGRVDRMLRTAINIV